jgi:hypothetical protein
VYARVCKRLRLYCVSQKRIRRVNRSPSTPWPDREGKAAKPRATHTALLLLLAATSGHKKRSGATPQHHREAHHTIGLLEEASDVSALTPEEAQAHREAALCFRSGRSDLKHHLLRVRSPLRERLLFGPALSAVLIGTVA